MSKIKVYTTPTHTPGIGGRPNTPEPWLQPHEFHSYIPALSTEETRIMDEVLAYGAPVYSLTEDMERLFFTPSRRRVDPSTPEEALAARKKSHQRPESPLRPQPPGPNRIQDLAVPQINPCDENHVTFRRKFIQKPVPTSPRYRGPVRVPLAELPRHEFAVRSRRFPRELRTQAGPSTSPVHWQHPRAAALGAQRTPPARSSSQPNLATLPAQSTQARVPVTPSTSNSPQSSSSACSGCGLAYICPHCSPNTSIQSSRSSVPSSSSSWGSTPPPSRAELDRNVRMMEGLAAKGRKLRDIIPSMAVPSGVPKAWRQKTEVEKWLEKEMAIQEQTHEH